MLLKLMSPVNINNNSKGVMLIELLVATAFLLFCLTLIFEKQKLSIKLSHEMFGKQSTLSTVNSDFSFLELSWRSSVSDGQSIPSPFNLVSGSETRITCDSAKVASEDGCELSECHLNADEEPTKFLNNLFKLRFTSKCL